MIYLDNSATTQPDPEVVEAMLPWLTSEFGNASSVYSLGRKARVVVENAREELASFLGAHPAELIFTSGGTESNNTVLKSCCLESEIADRLVVSAVEHHAILYPAEELNRTGIPLTYMPVQKTGVADTDWMEANVVLLNSHSTLISLMAANNETGVIQPLHRLRDLAPDALIHTDAVQMFGKMPFSVHQPQVDFVTISAHKIYGPKGIGALIIRKGIDFKAHQQGGAQERNRRAGTEPTALIAGFVTAARLAMQRLEADERRLRAKKTLLQKLLYQAIPAIRCNTPDECSLPHILNISFFDAEHLDGEAILQSMDMRGIAVSNGSACVSGSLQPSHVLSAMGLPASESRAAVRFSLSRQTTEEEITAAVFVLADILSSMREE